MVRVLVQIPSAMVDTKQTLKKHIKDGWAKRYSSSVDEMKDLISACLEADVVVRRFLRGVDEKTHVGACGASLIDRSPNATTTTVIKKIDSSSNPIISSQQQTE